MDWQKLLSSTRSNTDQMLHNVTKRNQRSPFSVDIDRIIFSTSFRKLQDKTQVYPLATSNKVRTRLTHTLEVSSVGKTLGHIIGKHIIQNHSNTHHIVNVNGYHLSSHDISYIVQAACLAHDIGNPPFGHRGEEAFINFYKNSLHDSTRQSLSNTEYYDLINFDGNTQGFRTLTNIGGWEEAGGYKLTYATLGAFCKYPRSSSTNDEKQIESSKKYKKTGIFKSELEQFNSIAEQLGLIKIMPNVFARHPLVFLVEAADDICYSVVDVEDSYHQGLTSFKFVEDRIAPIARHPNKYEGDSRKRTQDLKKQSWYADMPNNQKIEFLRGKAINNMIDEAAKVFINHEEDILNGAYDKNLLEDTPFSNNVLKCKNDIKKQVFESQYKLQQEISGTVAINSLLEYFNNIITYPNHLYSTMLNQNFFNNKISTSNSAYQNILLINDYIASLSDRQLLKIHKMITGLGQDTSI